MARLWEMPVVLNPNDLEVRAIVNERKYDQISDRDGAGVCSETNAKCARSVCKHAFPGRSPHDATANAKPRPKRM